MEITDLKTAGLPHSSVVRMKLFTFDECFVVRKAGRLAETDRVAVRRSLNLLLPLAG